MTGQWHIPAGTAFWGGTVTAPTQVRPFQEGRGNSLFIFTVLSSPYKTIRQQSTSLPSAGVSQAPPHSLYPKSESKSFEPELLWMLFLQHFRAGNPRFVTLPCWSEEGFAKNWPCWDCSSLIVI